MAGRPIPCLDAVEPDEELDAAPDKRQSSLAAEVQPSVSKTRA